MRPFFLIFTLIWLTMFIIFRSDESNHASCCGIPHNRIWMGESRDDLSNFRKDWKIEMFRLLIIGSLSLFTAMEPLCTIVSRNRNTHETSEYPITGPKAADNRKKMYNAWESFNIQVFSQCQLWALNTCKISGDVYGILI